ncbi:hypothetical protein [Kitasatospora sp. NPDC059327]|uniref:hypothetical protein n=1 Tax=Kitasatospora sp. NPDC059327 TaxID=3346803 RepID=UPI0036C9FB28
MGQITEETQEAAQYERHRSRVCDNNEDLAAIKGAIAQHKEWRRIGYVMAEEGLTTYDPDRDPTVQRWRREEHARQLAETAAQAQAAEHAATQQQTHRATDPKADTVLTALARAGLHNLTETDHQAAAALAQLDHTTIAQLTHWLERTRETALRLASPAAPVYRRPRRAAWPERT